MRFKIICFLIPMLALAQTPPEDPPKAETVRQFCEKLEKSMKSSWDQYYQWVAVLTGKAPGDRTQALELIDAIEKANAKDELSWFHLGCTQILYPPGNSRP